MYVKRRHPWILAWRQTSPEDDLSQKYVRLNLFQAVCIACGAAGVGAISALPTGLATKAG